MKQKIYIQTFAGELITPMLYPTGIEAPNVVTIPVVRSQNDHLFSCIINNNTYI